MPVKKNQLPPPEVVEVVRKVLELLGTVKGKLPKEAVAAMGILSSVIGYGKKLKEALNDQELRVVMDQLARVEYELGEVDLAASAIPSDVAQSIKALIRGLILVLRQSGAPYAYPAYTPPSGYGDPTYHYPFAPVPAPSAPRSTKQAPKVTKPEPKKQHEGIRPKISQASRLVESARLTEAVEGAEGLEWQIVLIEAGLSKNRKFYAPQVLRGAIPLFEGLSSYADHPSKADLTKGVDRSIRDLAGWVTNVQFDAEAGDQNRGAVVGIYHALASGPIAPLLREAWERGKPDLVQFSILGDGRQRMTRSEGVQLYFNVESIERLFSLDAVPQGAAGGRVQALIASAQEEVTELKMIEEMTLDQLAVLRPDLAGAVVSDQALAPPIRAAAPAKGDGAPADGVPVPGAPGLDALTEEVRRMQLELAMANRQRILIERVAASPLPEPVKDRLRDDFAGVVFDEAALNEAIDRESTIWKDILREKPQVLTVRETKSDRYSDALYGMLISEDVNGVARFHSLHQAYCAVKGLPFDTSRTAVADGLIREGIGFDPGSLLIESPSISWTLVFGTALQRKLVKDYQIPAFDEWRSIVSEIGNLDDFKEQKIERVGYYGLLPTVTKGATYQPLTSPGEEEATYEPLKKGGLEDWTWEDALNDDLGALKKIPKRLALSAKITLYQYVFNFLRDGNATATTYDGVNLFHATHGNMGTGAGVALSSAALTAAKISMRSQSALGSTVTFLAVRPKYLVVPNELEALSIQLKNSDYEVPAAATTTSTQVANPHKGSFEEIVVDYFTDANRWFLIGDPVLVPTIEAGFLGGKSVPELLTMAENVGSAFTADKIVFKARFVFGAAVLDHRGLYAADPNW